MQTNLHCCGSSQDKFSQYANTVRWHRLWVFSIVVATSLAYGTCTDPAKMTFQQGNLKGHLSKCLESGIMTVFPGFNCA